jgi:hypothetical protein
MFFVEMVKKNSPLIHALFFSKDVALTSISVGGVQRSKAL